MDEVLNGMTMTPEELENGPPPISLAGKEDILALLTISREGLQTDSGDTNSLKRLAEDLVELIQLNATKVAAMKRHSIAVPVFDPVHELASSDFFLALTSLLTERGFQVDQHSVMPSPSRPGLMQPPSLILQISW